MRRILILLIILVLLPAFVFAGKYYNGSSWVDTVRKRWDGSAWVETTTKRWDGTSWNVISAPVGETLFYLDFEGTQAEDLAGGWTVDQPTGALSLDYTSSISGNESFYARNNSSGYNSIYSPVLASPVNEIYYRLEWIPGGTNASPMHGPAFYGNGVRLGHVGIVSNYSIFHGTAATQVLAAPVVPGTTYYLCGRLNISTGIHSLNVGQALNPALNTTVSLTGGDAIGLIDQVRLVQFGSNFIVADELLVRTSPIDACAGAGL